MAHSFIPGLLWPILTFICLTALLAGLKAVLKRTGWDRRQQRNIWYGTTAAILLWVAMITALSVKGFFADFSKLPPRPLLAILLPLPVVLLAGFSKRGTQLIASTPPHWLVWMQSFRIIVELLLLLAFLAGNLPRQMTFEGLNFDVLTGILALPAGYLILKKKMYASKIAVAFNITGLLLLLNILTIAVLSMPTPFRYFMNEPSNRLVTQFPYILLPAVLVPLAYILHIFSLRQWYLLRSSANAEAKGLLHRLHT